MHVPGMTAGTSTQRSSMHIIIWCKSCCCAALSACLFVQMQVCVPGVSWLAGRGLFTRVGFLTDLAELYMRPWQLPGL